jgi:peptide/nickel transport system substrate-binding protein
VLVLLAFLGLVAGCTQDTPAPKPAPTTTATPRMFTVATTQTLHQFDPAYVTTEAGALVATAVYQRLMVYNASTREVKPDAATDCLFRQALVYECTLRTGLVFDNGNPLTSRDVKYSIERAIKLGAKAGTDVLFASLESIRTPDAKTVQFVLAWADTQFAQMLATPAASIVDEAGYPATSLRPDDKLPVGSGPYRVVRSSNGEVVFASNLSYQGATPAGVTPIRVQTMKDAASVEQSVIARTSDVAWNGLDDPAVTRLQQQIDSSGSQTTESGWTRVARTGQLVRRLLWNPASSDRLNAALRTRISLALQADRTLDSIVPRGVDGYASAFAQGGVATLPTTKTSGITLVLSYDSGLPGAAQVAQLVEERLQASAGLDIVVKPDDTNADIVLCEALPPLATAVGWLLPYLANPLPGSAAKIAQLDERVRTTTDANVRDVSLSELQQQAAADNVVIPVSQSDGALFVGPGVEIADGGFGPGGQLALWGLEQ